MINFPKEEFDLFIDVGLAFNAPHSVEALQNKKCFVIGFEPNPYAIKKIKELNLGERFHLIEAGVSDEEKGGEMPFNIISKNNFDLDGVENLNYQGTSSFLNITSKFNSIGYEKIKTVNVKTIRLDSILKIVPWHLVSDGLFDLKSDTQGYEDKVILGVGNYISKIRSLQIEVQTWGYYEQASNHFTVKNLLNEHLREVANDGGNAWFVRK